MHDGAHRRAAGGFTYIGVLVLVAGMGLSLSVLGPVWSTMQKRDKEAELLFVGDQFRRALEQYYRGGPAGAVQWPRSLEDLLQDPRYPGVRRYLRKIYPDPMTGSTQWGLVRTGGAITGVYSLSEDEPLKRAGFDARERAFEDKSRYSDWIFMPRVGGAAAARGKPGAASVPPQQGSASAHQGAGK